MTGILLGIVGIILAATAPQYKAQFFLLGLLTIGVALHKDGYRLEQPQIQGAYDYQQRDSVQREYPDYYPNPLALEASTICSDLDSVAAANGSVSQFIINAGNFNEIRFEVNRNCPRYMADLEAATAVLFPEPSGATPMYLDGSGPFYQLHKSVR